MQSGAEHRVAVDGVELRAHIDGAPSGPWLTFSNSLATDLGLWDEQVSALRGSYRILRYDTRGHGRSSAGPENIDMAQLVADALALFDHFGIRKTHFVGLSLGGMTGLGLALTAPQRLKSLTVAAARADAPESLRKVWDERCATAREKGMIELVDSTLARWFTQAFHARRPDAVAQIAAMIRATPVSGYVAAVNAIKSLDYKRRLGGIRVPTLFVCGRQDEPLPGEMETLSQLVPGSRYVLVENAAHLLNLEQPQAFMEPLKSFLAAH